MSEAATVTPKSVIAVGAVLPSLAAIAVALRFYVRIERKNYLSWDDFSILFALASFPPKASSKVRLIDCEKILTLALGIMMIIGSAVNALAQPTPLGDGPLGFFTVLNDAIVTTEKMKWAFNLLQVWILGSIKLSVICFYRRIFRGKTFELYSKCMIGIVFAWVVAFFFAFVFECGTNFDYLWSTLLNLITHCASEPTFFKGFAISDVLLDGLILMMPIPVIWRLQMSFERKLAVCAVFLMGFLAVAAGLARVGIFVTQLTDSYSQSQGILIITTWLYWSMLEIGLSIIAACLPTLRPLFGENHPRSWYKSLMSASRLRSKFSLGSKESKGDSSSSHSGMEPCMKTHVYPMQDVEAQTDIPKSGIAVQDEIEQSFSYKE